MVGSRERIGTRGRDGMRKLLRVRPRSDESFGNIYAKGRPPRRPLRTAGILLLATVVVLLIADGIYSIVNLRSRLNAMADGLDDGRQAVLDGDLPLASARFSDAIEEARAAAGFAARPSVGVASYLPLLGNDASVLRGLPDVGRFTARGGQTAVRAVRALGATSEGDLAQALYRNGQVQFGTIERTRVFVDRTDDYFGRAEAVLEGLPAPRVTRLVQAVGTARSRLTEARGQLSRATALMDVLPSMMGAEGPRRYLVAFLSNATARPSGGSIGLYGIVETRAGASRLLTVAPFALTEGLTPALLRRAGVDPQGPVLAQGASIEPTINSSPHFPEVARGLLAVFERSTGRTLDGVMAVDPIALGEFTTATGPLRGEGIDEDITEENAAQVILRESYVRFSEDPLAQNAFLESLIADFWSKLAAGDVNARALAEAFGTVARTKHLKIYSTDTDERAALHLFDLDGTFTAAGPNIQYVFHQNTAGNNVDLYLHRSIDTRVRVARDGFALVDAKLHLRNNAPRRLPEGLGSQDASSGANRMRLSVLLPQGASLPRIRIGGRAVTPRMSEEQGFPVIATDLVVPPKSDVQVDVSYRIEGAVELLRGGAFDLTFFPQAMYNPDEYSLVIEPPLGWRVAYEGTHEGLDNRGIRIGGTLDEEVAVHVEIRPL